MSAIEYREDDYGCVVTFGWYLHCSYIIGRLNDLGRAWELWAEQRRYLMSIDPFYAQAIREQGLR
jgi:hypothetical protein